MKRSCRFIFHSDAFVFFSLRYFSRWSDIRHLNSTTLTNTPGGATHSERSLPFHPHSWLLYGCCMPWKLLQEHWNRYCDRVLMDNRVKLYFITIVALEITSSRSYNLMLTLYSSYIVKRLLKLSIAMNSWLKMLQCFVVVLLSLNYNMNSMFLPAEAENSVHSSRGPDS